MRYTVIEKKKGVCEDIGRGSEDTRRMKRIEIQGERKKKVKMTKGFEYL